MKLWHEKQKKIGWPHLNDCGGDVIKKWYVEFSVTNVTTGEKVRTRIYDGFDLLKNAEAKYDYAEKIIREYRDKLESGWRPFDTRPVNQYSDELKYHGAAKIAGRNTATKSYILPLLSEYLKWKQPAIKHTSYLDYQSGS
jgi:hypothetical protein